MGTTGSNEQTAAQWTGSSTLIARIERVDLRVRDIDRALGFYRDVVGLEVAEREGSRAALRPKGGPVILTLDAQGVTAPAVRRAAGLFHTAIRFPSRSSLGDVLARLVDAKLRIGAGDHGVSEALYIDDPDGNGVELYRDRPREEWPEPVPGQPIPMGTDPVDLDGVFSEGGGLDAVGRPAPAGTDIGHVHLRVSNLDSTVAFYAGALGLDETASLGSAGFFSSNGYHHHVGANTWESLGAPAADPSQAGLTRVVFAVDDASEVDAARRRLQSAGYAVEGSAEELVVRDPDGIELRFVAA